MLCVGFGQGRQEELLGLVHIPNQKVLPSDICYKCSNCCYEHLYISVSCLVTETEHLEGFTVMRWNMTAGNMLYECVIYC